MGWLLTHVSNGGADLGTFKSWPGPQVTKPPKPQMGLQGRQDLIEQASRSLLIPEPQVQLATAPQLRRPGSGATGIAHRVTGDTGSTLSVCCLGLGGPTLRTEQTKRVHPFCGDTSGSAKSTRKLRENWCAASNSRL